MTLTWGVKEPPGDYRVWSATGQTSQCHVAALIHYDVLRHFVDVGWDWKQRGKDKKVLNMKHRQKSLQMF